MGRTAPFTECFHAGICSGLFFSIHHFSHSCTGPQ
uniref:Uncharacterized protein n=1 Tax=Anguilla anguilla TaxID=7936 RepID=A0A0E9PTL0_ANGAN